MEQCGSCGKDIVHTGLNGKVWGTFFGTKDAEHELQRAEESLQESLARMKNTKSVNVVQNELHNLEKHAEDVARFREMLLKQANKKESSEAVAKKKAAEKAQKLKK